MFNNRYAQNRGTFIGTLMGETSLFNTQMAASVAQASNVQDALKNMLVMLLMQHIKCTTIDSLSAYYFPNLDVTCRKLSHAI